MLCFSVTQFIFLVLIICICSCHDTLEIVLYMYIVPYMLFDVVIKGMVCIFLSLRATMNQ